MVGEFECRITIVDHNYMIQKNNFTSILISLIILSAASLLAYSNSFSGPFLFDDYHNIIGNEHVKISDLSFASLKNAAVEGPSKYRWLPKISFGLNYYFAGKSSAGYHADTGLRGHGFVEPDVRGYHLVNLLIHIAASFCLYFLFRATLFVYCSDKKLRRANEVALLGALLWAVHPVQTGAVTYIVQRMTSMEALFFLSSLLFYAWGRQRGVGVFRKIAFFLLSLGCGFLAVVSKENAAILPVIIMGYEFYFLGGFRFSRSYKNPMVISVLAVLLVYCLGWFYLGTNPFAYILQGYGARDFTLVERLLTQPRVIIHYLSLMVLPLPSRLNLAYDYPVSTALIAPPQTIAAILGIAALVFLILFLFKHNRLLSFAVFWFLLNLAIESSIIPLEIIFEHRIYLPSAFLFLALIVQGYQFAERRIIFSRSVFVILVLLLMLFTWQRNQTWSTRENVWADVTLKSPGLTRGHMGLYVAYRAQGRDDEALEALRKAIDVGPDEFSPLFNLANFHKDKKQHKQALQVLNAMLKRENLRTAPAYHLRASIYFDIMNYQAATADALKALEVDSGHLNAMLVLGSSYFRVNNFQLAAQYFEQAQEIEPETYSISFNLGTTYYNLGEYDKAILNYKRALLFMPNNPDIHYNLGMVYGAKGMVKEMQQEFELSKRLKGQAK